MRIPKSLWLLIPIVLVATNLEAVEIKATVLSVGNKSVQLKVAGDLLPDVGDKVEIFELFANVEPEAAVADGEVESVNDDQIQVKLAGSGSTIRTEYPAHISSPNPDQAPAAPIGYAFSGRTASSMPGIDKREMIPGRRWTSNGSACPILCP